MSKFLTKKSLFLMSVVTVCLLILSFIVNVVLGVNNSVNIDDHQTITVKVDSFHLNSDVEDVCETVFKDNGLKYVYVYHGETGGADDELTYVFKKSANLGNVETALETALENATNEIPSLGGAEIFVQTANEQVKIHLFNAYVWRTLAAVAVFAVLTFAYVALRYRLNMGLLAALSTVLGGGLAAAVILLVRVPVTTAALSVIAVSAMLSTVMTLFVLNKLRANLKTEEFEDKTAEETVVASYPCKELLALVGILGVAIILVGAIARLNVFFFGLTALIGLLCATLVGAGIVPAACVPVLEREKRLAADMNKSGYVGAKKSADNE